MTKGQSIEDESFRIIKAEMTRGFTERELPIIQRIIHATGDFDFENIIRFHPDAIERGCASIRQGKGIFVDVRMAEAGINKSLLKKFGVTVYCHISDDDVIASASSKGLTRAEVSVDKAVHELVGIIAIGNAPTALMRTIDYINNGIMKPDLVIGVPVGFVMAAESKELLYNRETPFITCLGTKGGTPVAVAIVNALMKLTT